MSGDESDTTLLHVLAAGMFAAFGLVIAVGGWLEALDLDVARSVFFARPGQPIETGWQPIAMGATCLLIGGGVALSILRHGFSNPGDRLSLVLIFLGSSAFAVFGLGGIFAGIEAFSLIEMIDGRGIEP